MSRPALPVIDDESAGRLADDLFPRDKGRGQEPRDYNEFPAEMFAPPDQMPLIPRSEWSARIREMEETRSRLSDVRGDIPSLDQGPNGYCWGHSTVHCVELLRARMNLPYVPLSAYSVCAPIKKGRNEGGWCGLSLRFLKDVGVAPQSVWPQGSRDLRLDTPAARAEMANYRVTDEWADLTRPAWGDDLTFDQVMTCLLNRAPVALDFNWWGHSVCGLDPVEVEPGSFGVRIWNSWADSWGDRGTAVLRGGKAAPDGAVGLRNVRAFAR